MRSLQTRASGQALSSIVFAMSFLIVGVVGVYAFNMAYLALARQQLQAACQAAAIAGAATLASSDNSDTLTMQNQAVQNAIFTFQQNSCLGNSLGPAQASLSPVSSVPSQACTLYMQLLDPNNNDAPVNLGNTNGKIFQVTATYGLVPAFAQYTHLSTVSLQATASAGVPLMDIVVVFDVSGSIDDQTPVTYVKRLWNPASGPTGNIEYQIASTAGGSPAGALAQGTIYNILLPPPTGSGFNATYPEFLSDSQSGDSYPLTFSESGGSTQGLRGSSDHSPPGNKTGVLGTPAQPGGATTYTDCVVNIDGNTAFGGITSNGFYFPNVATLVEAARGNLETQALFVASGASTAPALAGITPQVGYQAQYFQMAKLNVQPIQSAQSAASNFFTILNNDTNAHFGLVAFSTNAGNPPSNTITAANVDSSWPDDGNGTFPIPIINLSPAAGQTNFTQIQTALPTLTANGDTNIGDGLQTAVTMLQNFGRLGSRKAIVLFTDGEPTQGGPLNSDPWMNARAAAQKAATAGIPIYSIGLAQNAQIIPGETSILNDTNPDPSTGGVSAIAGNNGRFFLVTHQQYLRTVFENLAREFVTMVRTN